MAVIFRRVSSGRAVSSRPSIDRRTTGASGPEHADRHQDRDDGVEPVPSRERGGSDAHDDGDRGPDVRHEMVRVGLERDRLVPPARLEEHPRHAEVDDRRHGRNRQPQGRIADPDGMKEPLAGGDDDADRRDQDQRALEPAREVLRLRVTIGMIFVGGADGHRQREQRDDCREQVDQGLERVGQQRDRAGEEIGAALEGNGDERREDRQRGVANGAWPPHPTSAGRRRATSATVSGALPSARLLTNRYAGMRACTAVSISRTRSCRRPGLGS